MPSKDSERCATRYPLLLVHGVGVRDSAKESIWGRIPRTLRAEGAQVYCGEHDGWGTSATNAEQLRQRVDTILAECSTNKVNIIAHSKGGLDARHLIALYTSEPPRSGIMPVASLTTIATPHRGSRTLELLLSSVARFAFRPLAALINRSFKRMGDKNPDFIGACKDLSASQAELLNEQQPSLLPVYSQQFTSCLQSIKDSMVSLATYPFILHIEGPNDGLVTLESAAYDNFCGELRTSTGRGISHAALVDVLRKPFSARTQQESPDSTDLNKAEKAEAIPLQVDDILDFYRALVSDLKARGY